MENGRRFGPALVWSVNTLVSLEWKYVHLWPTSAYLEKSIFLGMEWVVFEPNGAAPSE